MADEVEKTSETSGRTERVKAGHEKEKERIKAGRTQVDQENKTKRFIAGTIGAVGVATIIAIAVLSALDKDVSTLSHALMTIVGGLAGAFGNQLAGAKDRERIEP